MSWHAYRTDANQNRLLKIWREEIGGTAENLAMVGGGFPDVLLGLAGEMALVEIKTAKGRLNGKQRKWMAQWRGPEPRVIRTVDELVQLAQELLDRAAQRRDDTAANENGRDHV